ncbi:alpha/beta fold hydrolase [Collimonas pratensis]|uniref:alpha/beta fold hydrolase n=1 Tax=Collimonas pratensis TaxID=279113 RepID=UPI00143CC245|nr:alpha/beta fold hydrolase [Collimonas pratensis]
MQTRSADASAVAAQNEVQDYTDSYRCPHRDGGKFQQNQQNPGNLPGWRPMAISICHNGTIEREACLPTASPLHLHWRRPENQTVLNLIAISSKGANRVTQADISTAKILPRAVILSGIALALTAALTFAIEAQAQEKPLSPAALWSAPATASVSASELQFNNGQTTLSGTLYAPQLPGKAPAVIVLHAASVPTRDQALYRHLIQALPALGIAVFVYDRRGSGKSGGMLADSDYDVLADDGIAAQRMLARDARIDPRRIGFWGLSQGGWLSLLAAARSPETAFAIAISAPMTTPDVQMNFAVANILRIKGYPEADVEMAVAARTAVDEYERGRLGRATAQARLDAVVDKPWFDLAYLDKTFEDPGKSRWAKEIRHDPLKTLDAVHAPALVIYGAKDPWVPAKLSADILHKNAAQHPNIDTAVIAGADHDMMLSAPLEFQIDPKAFSAQAPDAPEYFSLMAAWLTAKGFACVH